MSRTTAAEIIAKLDLKPHPEGGPHVTADETPQAMVPARAWQAAETLGDWTLCRCTVSPGFRFEGFELAPKGWSPHGR